MTQTFWEIFSVLFTYYMVLYQENMLSFCTGHFIPPPKKIFHKIMRHNDHVLINIYPIQNCYLYHSFISISLNLVLVLRKSMSSSDSVLCPFFFNIEVAPWWRIPIEESLLLFPFLGISIPVAANLVTFRLLVIVQLECKLFIDIFAFSVKCLSRH